MFKQPTSNNNLNFITFNKKEANVKSFFRKGKLVKAHKKLINKRNKKIIRNVLIGLGVATAGTLATRQLLKSNYKGDNKILKKAMDIQGQVMAHPYKPKNVPDLTKEELKKVEDKIEASIKKAKNLTTKETGDDFFDLRDRRDAKNKYIIEQRKNNARGVVGKYGYYDANGNYISTYNEKDDMLLAINKNRRQKGDRKERKELAKKLIKQLGGRYSTTMKL